MKSTMKFDDIIFLLPRSQVDDGDLGSSSCIQVQGINQNLFELATEGGQLVFFFSFFCDPKTVTRVAKIEPHRLGYSSDIVPRIIDIINYMFTTVVMVRKISGIKCYANRVSN